jgi:hypothetical protein
MTAAVGCNLSTSDRFGFIYRVLLGLSEPRLDTPGWRQWSTRVRNNYVRHHSSSRPASVSALQGEKSREQSGEFPHENLRDRRSTNNMLLLLVLGRIWKVFIFLEFPQPSNSLILDCVYGFCIPRLVEDFSSIFLWIYLLQLVCLIVSCSAV